MPIDLTHVRVHHEAVLVRPLREPEQSAGGIYKPDASRAHQQRGIVLAVGPGELLPNGERRPIAVAPGDLVMFNRYAGFQLSEDSSLVILRDLEIPVSYAAGSFPLVTHEDDPDAAHLEGEYCEQCELAAGEARKGWFQSLRSTTADAGALRG